MRRMTYERPVHQPSLWQLAEMRRKAREPKLRRKPSKPLKVKWQRPAANPPRDPGVKGD